MELIQHQNNKISELEHFYQLDKTGIIFDVLIEGAEAFSVHARDKSAYQDMALLAQHTGKTVNIKGASNNYVSVTFEQLKYINVQYVLKGVDLWTRVETLKATVRAATTAAAVSNVVW